MPVVFSRAFALGLLLLLALGCADRGATRARDAGHDDYGVAVSSGSTTDPARIISLSAAISRTLVDFNLQDKVVGRTPHCEALDQTIPIVGDLLNIDYEQIIRLNPTHILVQPPQSGLDARLQQLAQEHHWTIGQWHLDSIDDIEKMVREIPTTLFAEGSKEQAEATTLAATILNRIAAALAPGSKPVYQGRVMLVYSLSPISVAGKGTYLDGILTAIGGTNATNANDWVSYSLEDFAKLAPDAVILVKPGWRGGDLAWQLDKLWALDVPASVYRRVAVLKHRDSFLPSTGVVDVAEELRSILEQIQAENP